MAIRRKSSRRSVILCSFLGCDDVATDTIGITPFCPLHRAYVTDMLDHKNQPGANLELGEALVEQWLLADARSDRRELRG